MKFSCSQQALSRAIGIVSRAISSRTTMPILKGILLEVKDNMLTMSASDLDISIKTKVKIYDAEEGTAVVGSKLFGDIVRKMPPEMVMVDCAGGSMNILCHSSSFTIQVLSAMEYPEIPAAEEDMEAITIDGDVLRDMIRKTVYAASIDEARGVITGVKVVVKEDGLEMVALDGFRMSVVRKPQAMPKTENMIIPARILSEVNRILGETGDEDDEVRLLLNDKRAIFIYKETTVLLRLLEGEFIRYEDIIPKTWKTQITVEREAILNSIERASLLARGGKNNLIRMEMTEDSLTITSRSEEGNNREVVEVKKEGDDLVIGFNSKYLTEALKATDDAQVVMRFTTPTSPCLIEPTEGRDYTFMVLPVRIAG